MKILVLFMLAFAYSSNLLAQNKQFNILFYNVENYFDPKNDPDTDDDEFTPEGNYHWTSKRFVEKRNNIYKTIVGIDAGRVPDLIGLCEIENRYVLNQLVYETPLSKYGYQIAHRESPDPRGIDVALLYRKDRFEWMSTSFYSMNKARTANKSREILYVRGRIDGTDTLHVLVNHWPSKRGGETKSAPRRTAAALVLRGIVDSIFKTNPKAAICIMGDFNDYPDSKAIQQSLRAQHQFNNIQNTAIYNLAYPRFLKNEGSLKYKNRWEMIDMIMVSGAMLQSKAPIMCRIDGFKLFNNDFLLEPLPAKGFRPKRTYIGMKYHGGYSDHLPVGLTLYLNYE